MANHGLHLTVACAPASEPAVSASEKIMNSILIIAIRIAGLFLIIQFLLGAFFWFKPKNIIRFFSTNESEETPVNISALELQNILISTLAIYLLFISISDLVYYLGLHYSLKQDLGYIYEINPETKAGFISSISTLILSMFLLAKSNQIASSLIKMIKKNN